MLNNPIALISPVTANIDIDGFDVVDTDELEFRDAAANATVVGRLRRNATDLTWFGVLAGRLFYAGQTTAVPIADGGTASQNATAYGVVIASTATRYAMTAALTNGQVVIGRTNLTPVAATLTAGANITITNAAGAVTIDSTATLNYVAMQAFL